MTMYCITGMTFGTVPFIPKKTDVCVHVTTADVLYFLYLLTNTIIHLVCSVHCACSRSLQFTVRINADEYIPLVRRKWANEL